MKKTSIIIILFSIIINPACYKLLHLPESGEMEIPTVLYPEDGANNIPLNYEGDLMLLWDYKERFEDKGDYTYSISISKNSDFQQLCNYHSAGSMGCIASLEHNTTYYWKISVGFSGFVNNNHEIYNSESSVWSFTTAPN